MLYFISDQNAETGHTHVNFIQWMSFVYIGRRRKSLVMIIAEKHLLYKVLVALDLLFKVTEGRAGQN